MPDMSKEDLKIWIDTSIKENLRKLELKNEQNKIIEGYKEKIADLEAGSQAGLNHSDLKLLGIRYCPEGNCGNKELWSDQEWENLEECDNCDQKIANPDTWANCPGCGKALKRSRE